MGVLEFFDSRHIAYPSFCYGSEEKGYEQQCQNEENPEDAHRVAYESGAAAGGGIGFCCFQGAGKKVFLVCDLM